MSYILATVPKGLSSLAGKDKRLKGKYLWQATLKSCPRSRKMLLKRYSTDFSKSSILLCSTRCMYKKDFVINYPLKEHVGNQSLEILSVTDIPVFALLQPS